MHIKTIDTADLENVVGGKGVNCDGPPPGAFLGNLRWKLGNAMGLRRGCPTKEAQPTDQK